MTEKDQGVWLANEPCPDCDSKDNLSIYEKSDGTIDGYCQTLNCPEGQYKSNNKLAKYEYLAEKYDISIVKTNRGKRKVEGRKTRKRSSKEKTPKKIITKKEVQDIRNKSSLKGNSFRKIKDKYNEKLRIRTSFDNDDNVKSRWYPLTEGTKDDGNPNLVGYKQRVCATKDFYPTGKMSLECDLFNQWNCKGKGKYLLIAAGEEDVVASVQMLEDLREKRSRRGKELAPVDVVSSCIGEGSVAKQCQRHYDFISGYDNVIIAMDMDDAGQLAVEELLKVLPFNKIKIMEQPEACKDPSDAVQKGLEKEWLNNFYYNCSKPKVVGLVSTEEMWEQVIDSVSKPLIPLPPMLAPLEEMLCGGLPYAEIINLLAGSGAGKTTITNELELYWIFNSPYKVGVISLEAGTGKFLSRLLSSYLGKNIARFRTPKEKKKFLNEHKEKCFQLFKNEEGEDRFSLVDDKGDLDSLDKVKETIERMIRQAGCKIIIIDPIQDLLDYLSIEDQAAFVGWQKKMKARDEVTFINVNHTRKSGGGNKAGSQGGELTEEDMQGTSALYKSGAVNIILTRDKTAENAEDRNTTKITLFKSRDAGETGVAGYLFYDVETAKLYNKDEWLESQIEDV